MLNKWPNENPNGNKYMQNFTVFQTFVDSRLKNYPFFLDFASPIEKLLLFRENGYEHGTCIRFGRESGWVDGCVWVWVGVCVCVWVCVCVCVCVCVGGGGGGGGGWYLCVEFHVGTRTRMHKWISRIYVYISVDDGNEDGENNDFDNDDWG